MHLFIFCMKYTCILVVSLTFGACASHHSRPVATVTTRESSSRIVSRTTAPIDDAEVRQLRPKTTIVSKKKPYQTNQAADSSEEVETTSTMTDTVVGTVPVASPDSEIRPQ